MIPRCLCAFNIYLDGLSPSFAPEKNFSWRTSPFGNNYWLCTQSDLVCFAKTLRVRRINDLEARLSVALFVMIPRCLYAFHICFDGLSPPVAPEKNFFWRTSPFGNSCWLFTQSGGVCAAEREQDHLVAATWRAASPLRGSRLKLRSAVSHLDGLTCLGA
jgi:hypothetical protein